MLWLIIFTVSLLFSELCFAIENRKNDIMVIIFSILTVYVLCVLVGCILEYCSLSLKLKGKEPGKFFWLHNAITERIMNINVSPKSLDNFIYCSFILLYFFSFVLISSFLLIVNVEFQDTKCFYITVFWVYFLLLCLTRAAIIPITSNVKSSVRHSDVNGEYFLASVLNLLYLIFFAISVVKGIRWGNVGVYKYIKDAFVAYGIFSLLLENIRRIKTKQINEAR